MPAFVVAAPTPAQASGAGHAAQSPGRRQLGACGSSRLIDGCIIAHSIGAPDRLFGQAGQARRPPSLCAFPNQTQNRGVKLAGLTPRLRALACASCAGIALRAALRTRSQVRPWRTQWGAETIHRRRRTPACAGLHPCRCMRLSVIKCPVRAFRRAGVIPATELAGQAQRTGLHYACLSTDVLRSISRMLEP